MNVCNLPQEIDDKIVKEIISYFEQQGKIEISEQNIVRYLIKNGFYINGRSKYDKPLHEQLLEYDNFVINGKSKNNAYILYLGNKDLKYKLYKNYLIANKNIDYTYSEGLYFITIIQKTKFSYLILMNSKYIWIEKKIFYKKYYRVETL